MNSDQNAFADGVGQVVQESEGISPEETACAKGWLKKITDAREFDKNARTRYAIDRKLARRETGFDVALPIAASYTDILQSFLFARDPDLDCEPSPATTPPPMSEIMDMARVQVMSDPAVQVQIQQASQMAGDQAKAAGTLQIQGTLAAGEAPQALPPDPNVVAAQAAMAKFEELAKARANEIMAPYQKRQSEAKQLGETLATIIAHLWKKAGLKAACRLALRSAITCGPGWLKCTWQERMGEDPTTRKQISDLQDNVKRLAALQVEQAEGESANPDLLMAEIRQQIAGLEAKVEVIVSKGLAIDFFPAEDVQVSTDVALVTSYRDADWVANKIHISVEKAKEEYPKIKDKLASAKHYYPQKPRDPADQTLRLPADVDSIEAENYRTNSGVGADTGQATVCIWEVWDHRSNMIVTVVEGVDCYACEPYAPNPGTSRFQQMLLIAPIEVDGERHPESMVNRTRPLLEDMDRLYSKRREHRGRCIPKTVFDSAAYEPEEVAKVEQAVVGEMVGLKSLDPTRPIASAFAPIAYPGIDEALYDAGPTQAMLEMAWGIQEALTSSIQTPKTATEADIQQKGTEARTNYMADALDEMLSDLALMTAEIAIQKLSREDAKAIAGPWAFWPEGIGIEGLSQLVNVNIRAGSSGKPHSAMKQRQWQEVLPTATAMIQQIGQLRGSSPNQIADALEAVMVETFARSGDKTDPTRFIPGEPDSSAAPALQPGALQAAPPIQPGSTPGPPGAMLQ